MTSGRLFTSDGRRGANTSVPVASASSSLATAGIDAVGPDDEHVGVDLVGGGDALEVLAAQQHASTGRAPLVGHGEDGGADDGRPERAGCALDLDLVAQRDAGRSSRVDVPERDLSRRHAARARRAA